MTPVLAAAATAAFLLVASSACGLYGEGYTSECVLSDEQSATLNGYWAVTPVPVAVQAGAFSDAEKASITSAVSAWNAFFQSARGFPVFDIGSGTIPESSRTEPASLCQVSFVSGSAFTREVVIYKRTAGWTGTDASSKLADTQFCYGSTVNGKKSMKSAVMKLNYQYRFTSATQDDLESVVGHELGHLIGLGHSCDASNKSGMPNCNTIQNSDYLSALMFPAFASGEVRRNPRKNDQERANCLYDPSL